MQSTRVRHGLAVALIVGALVALGFFIDAAVRYPIDQATAWFTGIGVIVAITAVVLAGLAALFAYPAYHDWLQAQRRQPDIAILLEAGHNPESLARIDPAEPFTVPVSGWFLRVTIANRGSAPVLAGTLLAAVPNEKCRINPDPEARFGLLVRAIPGPIDDPDIVFGELTKVNATEIRDDFPPGNRIYLLQGVQAISSPFPLMVRVVGDGLTHPVITRATLVAK